MPPANRALLRNKLTSVQIGAAFVLNNKDPAYTDFIGAGGPNAYSWNVIRSEADDLIFRHAGKSGAQIFDGVKVSNLEFAPHEGPSTADAKTLDPGRPVSATWTRKEDGATGTIKFDYLVDASGRQGIMSTKHLKNRHFNQGLKNVASWGYWKGAGRYGVGTPQEGVPYFEALSDGSGWCWFIPLHNDTVSVGVVINQEVATKKKREMGSPGGKAFYLEMLKSVPRILGPMLKDAELVSDDIKAASDWSYSASSYASYGARIVGDAGCFIDPFFSSGVHLAVASGLSAAATIASSIKGETTEHEALEWHSKKVGEGYTRFLLIVLSALKQIREHDDPVLSDWDEAGFDRAFAHFRPSKSYSLPLFPIRCIRTNKLQSSKAPPTSTPSSPRKKSKRQSTSASRPSAPSTWPSATPSSSALRTSRSRARRPATRSSRRT